MAERHIHLHPLAADEAEAARVWYAERNPRAAEMFLDELDFAIARVAENPQRWPQLRGRFRRYIFPKFPFSLVYRFTPTSIEVVAVAHHRRKPAYWKLR
ncbi:MAG: type II toxin-antitoxin system RelE/ParE family toxin [Steroidobacteraceae bacterium]